MKDERRDARADGCLAIDGGPKAFPRMHGRKRPKIGVEEFMSIAERFGFSSEALARIRGAVSDEDLGDGPTLSRFATARPPATKGEAYEKLAREILGVKYAMGVSSGTGALHAAMVAVGVGPGTEVIVPAKPAGRPTSWRSQSSETCSSSVAEGPVRQSMALTFNPAARSSARMPGPDVLDGK